MRLRRDAAARNAFGAADFLYLAAAPTFAVMALLTSVLGGGPRMRCVRWLARHRSSGMVPMYLLMSAFHLAPWLKLIRRDVRLRHADPAFAIPLKGNNMSKAYNGGCACGAIRYEISGEPVFMNHCQCLDCQRRSGTGHGSYLTFADRQQRQARRQGGALRRRRRQRQRQDPQLLPGLRLAGLPDICGDAGSSSPCTPPASTIPPASSRRPSPTACAVTPGTISIRACRNSTRCRRRRFLNCV